MNTIKVKNGIYYIGTLNPNLRVFDIIMTTEFGTTYNAYLVKGEKTALIEAVHEEFCDEYLDRIRSITSICDIDYLILNHTEPDHSGSVFALLSENPNLTIVATSAGIKNMSSITNAQFNSRVVRDGDTLDLGAGMELKFIIAPNLHWPDTMFTYTPRERVLFSCDFLGAHYCEPRLFDDKVVYEKNYENAFKGYYDAILSPFKSFVLAGLDKISNIDFDLVCTSHGPLLRGKIDEKIALYKKWSTPHINEKKRVAIFYVSAYGYTREMAKVLSTELKLQGLDCEIYDIIYHDILKLKEELEIADAIMLGSPTINRDALKPVWDLLSVTDAIINKGKPCGIFGSYGWSGEACDMLAQRAESLKLKLIGNLIKVKFKPTEEDFKFLREYAEEFAKNIQ